MILEINGRLDTGLKFIRISLSRLGFLSNGLTIADLRSDGKIPSFRHALTISVITGASVGRISQRRLVGIGSRGHEVLADFLIIEIISERVVGRKESNLEDLGNNVSTGGHCKPGIVYSMLARSDRIFDIFDMKKLLKV